MANFPLLKTGAVTQYPLGQTIRFRSEAVQFLDGSRQRYRLFATQLRQWHVSLDLLDDSELAMLTAFLVAQGSAAFAFTDPVSGQTVPRCAIAGDQYQWAAKGEMQGGAKLSIEEIP